MDIKSILVGVDFSGGSRSAFRYAAGLARRFGARVVLVNVISDHDVRLIASVTGEDEDEVRHRLRHDATHRLNEFVAAEGETGVFTENLISIGLPYHQLALKARELAADLLVVGGQGMSRDRVAEMFFGATAEKVVRLLPCPVLCVPYSGGE